ncbi:hypothetical protein DRO48_01495 [Candidatus Bathyarchaeota archaeon]|nr:MAG: hypothetical protein DRO48_01495 [Candidatus Bathyarchaeota archaeon]
MEETKAMRVWKVRPLHTAILEELEKNGSLTDEELLRNLRPFYSDLTIRELSRELMRMEIGGLVRVSALARGKRIVELVRSE